MPVSGTPRQIVHQEMHRFKHGRLHSGSDHGPIVKNRQQAIAIALSEARRHKRAAGGGLAGMPTLTMPAGGGAASPFQNTNFTGMGNPNPPPIGGAMPSMPGNSTPQSAPSPMPMPAQPSPSPFPNTNFTGMGSDFGHEPVMGGPTSAGPMPSISPPPPSFSPMSSPPTGATSPFNYNFTGSGNPDGQQAPWFDPGFMAALRARRGYAFGGLTKPPQPSWTVRNEARSMLHSGPITSAVPGRTDRHNVSVGSGAYVLPADHVSALGQGNTKAGHAILSQMFGGNGPYGGGRDMALKHGPGAPKPPAMRQPGGFKMPKFVSTGGGKGDHVGHPVPIVVAGGEYTIPPEVVAAIGGGDIKHGHKILDDWVLSTRKKHIKTLRSLPGPAKA